VQQHTGFGWRGGSGGAEVGLTSKEMEVERRIGECLMLNLLINQFRFSFPPETYKFFGLRSMFHLCVLVNIHISSGTCFMPRFDREENTRRTYGFDVGKDEKGYT